MYNEISMSEVSFWQIIAQETESCMLRYECLRLQFGKLIA